MNISKSKTAKFFVIVTLFACLQLPLGISSASNFLTKADFAKIFCETFSIKESSEISFFKDINSSTKNSKWITPLGFAFPNARWDGKQWSALPNQVITDEMALKTFVIYFGFPLSSKIQQSTIKLQYSLQYTEDVLPYLDALLRLGVDSSRLRNDKELTDIELRSDLQIYKNLKSAGFASIPASSTKIISNVSTNLKQEYYQDGPIENFYDVQVKTDKTQRLHQITAVRAQTEINSSKVGYGIGIWGSATANVSNSKIVGGFFTVRGSGSGMNSQMVGQEIDVINSAPPPVAQLTLANHSLGNKLSQSEKVSQLLQFK